MIEKIWSALFVIILTGNLIIFVIEIVPALRRHDQHSEWKFWFDPLYYYKSLSKYHDICKKEEKSLKWLHWSNFAFAISAAILLYLMYH